MASPVPSAHAGGVERLPAAPIFAAHYKAWRIVASSEFSLVMISHWEWAGAFAFPPPGWYDKEAEEVPRGGKYPMAFNPIHVIFGLKLRQARLEKGLSVTELAERSQLSPSYVTEIEKGRKYPKADKIMRLAQALGYDY